MKDSTSKKILTRLLVRSYRFIKHTNSAFLREKGYDQIKIGHVMVMMNLREEPVAVSELVRVLEMSKQALSVLIKELQAKNFVSTLKNPRDSRAIMVSKTADGNAFLKVLEASRQNLDQEIGEILGLDRLENLKELLYDLVNHFETKVGKLNDKIGNTKL